MIKKSIIYIFIVYLMQVLSIVLNILLIRNLSLDNLGQITLAKVYFQFMDFLHLGSRFSIDRYVPTANETTAELIVNTSLIVSTITFVIVASFIHFFVNDSTIVLLFMSSGFVFAQGTIYKAYFRARENIKDMIFVILITSLIPLLIQLIAIYFFDFTIYIILFFLSYFFSFIFLLYKFQLLQKMSISLLIDKIQDLFSASSVLFLISLVIFFSFSIDKVLLEHYKGSSILGEYSIILFVFATLLVIPGTLSELVFPKIIKKVENTAKVFYWKETAFIFFPTLLAIIVANLFMDFFINTFTNYGYLLHYLHLISWAVLPYSVISIMYHTLNALDLRVTILKINIAVFLFFSLYILILMKSSENILQYLVFGRIVYGILLAMLYVLNVALYSKRKTI